MTAAFYSKLKTSKAYDCELDIAGIVIRAD